MIDEYYNAVRNLPDLKHQLPALHIHHGQFGCCVLNTGLARQVIRREKMQETAVNKPYSGFFCWSSYELWYPHALPLHRMCRKQSQCTI